MVGCNLVVTLPLPHMCGAPNQEDSLRKTTLYKKSSGCLALAHVHNSSHNYDNRVKVNLQIFYDPLVVFHDLVILFKLVFYDLN